MPEPDARVWSEVLAHLRRHHPGICRQWFDEIELLGVSGGVARLRAQSGFHRDYLQKNCLEQFNDAVQAVTQRLLPVRFLGPEDEPDDSTSAARLNGSPAPAHVVASTIEARPLGSTPAPSGIWADTLTINPDHTFENFVIGPGNRLAHAAAIAVADRPGKAYNPLFIHGGVGLGKTHLLQAVCLRILQKTPGTTLYYTSCDSFVDQYFQAVQDGQMGGFRHKFRDVDVLVIDDIHFIGKRERSQEEFHHTFNSLYQGAKQIILSSDAAPEEIPHLTDGLVSRFKQGMVALIQPPDFETRVAIVKAKARMRGLDLADEVTFHIATIVDTNIRELEGALTRIQVQASVDGRPIDLAVAKAAIGDPMAKAAAEPTLHVIVSAVTEYFGVRVPDVQSKRRARSVAVPRQVCMYLARKHTRHSLEEIGAYFGGRDHTTVMYSVEIVEERRKTDRDFDLQVTALDDRLRKSNA